MQDGPITWEKLNSYITEFHSVLDTPISNAGVSPTTFVRYQIPNLIANLANLMVAYPAVTNIDVYLIKYPSTDQEYPNRISVAFAGAGLISNTPSDALPYNIGEVNP